MMVQYVGRVFPLPFFRFRFRLPDRIGSALHFRLSDAGAPTVPSLKKQQRQHFGLIDAKAAARNLFFFFFLVPHYIIPHFRRFVKLFPHIYVNFLVVQNFPALLKKLLTSTTNCAIIYV